MKTHTEELLQMEIAALRDAVNQHGETAALYAANAAWQDHAIADAEQAMVEADEKLHKAKALRAFWLWKAATEHADGEDAAHALERAVERLNDTTTSQQHPRMMPMLALIIALSLAAHAAEPARTVTATVTAYCACTVCCGKNAKGITASGTRPVQGRTVAAPRSVPLGTRIHIEGLGWRVVEDRTARRYDGRVDIYFASHKDALNWGIKQRKIVIETK